MTLLPALLSAQEPEGVCPLTDKQTQQALDAFGKLAPIFGTPRCFNCHGGVSPFGAGRNHPAANGFKIERNPDGEENIPATFTPCQDCHSKLGRWRLAPALAPGPDMRFTMNGVPKTSRQLCEQMKTLFPSNAQRFIAHMTDDEGGTPFLDVAFAGTKALNQEGLDVATQKVPDPIDIMTRPQMLKFAKDWVQAMNNEFSDPTDCGCATLRYAVQLDANGTVNIAQGPASVNAGFRLGAGNAPPAIPIQFHDDGSVTGEATVDGSGKVNAQGGALLECGGESGSLVQVVIRGNWPQACTDQCTSGSSSKITLAVQMMPIDTHGSATCSALGHTSTGTGGQSGGQTYSFQFALDPQVGATQTVPWTGTALTGTVQATLVRVQ
jgi:hypothetical protein